MRRSSLFGAFLIVTGVLLIVSALYLFVHNEQENVRSKEVINEALVELNAQLEVLDHRPKENNDASFEEVVYDGYYALLTIPDLNIQLPIYNEYSEEMLKVVPCRFADNVFCGHNSRAQFSFLSKLKDGDLVIVTYLNGSQSYYEVAWREVIEPDDVLKMLDTEYDLTLFTCTPTNSARYTVRFRQITVD